MDSAKKLMINIVTWNSVRYLPNIFTSLDHQSSTDFTVTVVDNASTDGTPQWVGEHRADAVLLKNFRNLGFARAHNQAMALAFSRWEGEDLTQRYVMIANPDMEWDEQCIERLIAFMDAHPDIAACGPKLLRATVSVDSDDTHLSAERTDVIDAMGIAIAKSRRVIDRGAGETDTGQYDSATRVFGLSGACVMYRASALQQARMTNDDTATRAVATARVGEWLDEDFFMYQEDVDLAWRMRLMGMECHLVPLAVAWHYRRSPGHAGGWLTAWRSRRIRSSHINYYSTRNHGWLLLKNDQWSNVLRHAIWWLPYECAKCIAGLFSLTQLKAELAGIAGVPRMVRKRKEVMRRATASAQKMREWFV